MTLQQLKGRMAQATTTVAEDTLQRTSQSLSEHLRVDWLVQRAGTYQQLHGLNDSAIFCSILRCGKIWVGRDRECMMLIRV